MAVEQAVDQIKALRYKVALYKAAKWKKSFGNNPTRAERAAREHLRQFELDQLSSLEVTRFIREVEQLRNDRAGLEKLAEEAELAEQNMRKMENAAELQEREIDLDEARALRQRIVEQMPYKRAVMSAVVMRESYRTRFSRFFIVLGFLSVPSFLLLFFIISPVLMLVLMLGLHVAFGMLVIAVLIVLLILQILRFL
ncbi:MAG: hypothetical protein NZ571_13250, partial [Anaerolineae bacterium]|nr:hypothetical protein [Anaerolineae bacterium]